MLQSMKEREAKARRVSDGARSGERRNDFTGFTVFLRFEITTTLHQTTLGRLSEAGKYLVCAAY